MLWGNKRSYILNSSKSTKSKVFLKEFFNKFKDIGKLQLLMHSHFLKKFLMETLRFSMCWLFLNKLNNEIVVINITPTYNFNSPDQETIIPLTVLIQPTSLPWFKQISEGAFTSSTVAFYQKSFFNLLNPFTNRLS